MRADRHLFRGHHGTIVCVAFSRDGSRLATASLDGTAQLYWTDEPKRDPVVLGAHEGVVSSVAFSPDGERVATSDDGTARIWSLDGVEWAAIDTGGGRVWDVAFSADGSPILTVTLPS